MLSLCLRLEKLLFADVFVAETKSPNAESIHRKTFSVCFFGGVSSADRAFDVNTSYSTLIDNPGHNKKSLFVFCC